MREFSLYTCFKHQFIFSRFIDIESINLFLVSVPQFCHTVVLFHFIVYKFVSGSDYEQVLIQIQIVIRCNIVILVFLGDRCSCHHRVMRKNLQNMNGFVWKVDSKMLPSRKNEKKNKKVFNSLTNGVSL